MGTLRSDHDHTGLTVNGITLGEPARTLDADQQPIGPYFWDDARLPNGEIAADGIITPDDEEL